MAERSAKRRRFGQNPFIDTEALVDEEGDMDDELIGEDEDDFDEDDDIIESGEMHSRLALHMDQDAEAGRWTQLVARAKSRSSQRPLFGDAGEDDAYVLSHEDGLWEIGCKVGYEDVAVYKILEASLDGPQLARSVVAHPGMPGRVYAEVASIAEARRLAAFLPGLNKSAIRYVPLEELGSILRIKKGPSLYSWAWVRVCDRRRRWAKYRGDVGIVRTRDPDGYDAKHFGNRKWIHLVPRLFLPTDEDQSFFPPPQRLLTRDLIDHHFGEEYVKCKDMEAEDPNLLSFRGEDYDIARGLLVVEAEKLAIIAEPGILPSRHELRLINQDRLIPRDVYLRTFEAIERRDIGIGARVMVKSGDFKGLVGIVQKRNDQAEACTVDLSSQGVTVDIPIRSLRTEFRCGDRLKVVSGIHQGTVGWVVDVEDKRPKTNNVVLVNSEIALDPIKVSILDVIFYEDDVVATTLRPRNAKRSERGLGPRDPNHIYIGKHVVVINKSQWKGYRGIIKNTSPDGLAWVEFQAILIAHNGTEVFKLEQLGIRRADGRIAPAQSFSGEGLNDIISELPIPVLPEPGTPMPVPEDSDELSPAWDPSSRTPLPSSGLGLSPAWDPSSLTPLHEALSPDRGPTSATRGPEKEDRPSPTFASTDGRSRTSSGISPPDAHASVHAPSGSQISRRAWHVLKDDLLQGSRIKLRRKDVEEYSILEFVRAEGDYAVIREGGKQLQEHLDGLVPMRPANINDCVIPLSGPDKGKLFKVKAFGDDGQCVIHRVGSRLLKGQKDPVCDIADLATTYLFR